MNGIKFFALVVLAISAVIIVLDNSQTQRPWHTPALAGISVLTLTVIFTILNSNGRRKVEGPRN